MDGDSFGQFLPIGVEVGQSVFGLGLVHRDQASDHPAVVAHLKNIAIVANSAHYFACAFLQFADFNRLDRTSSQVDTIVGTYISEVGAGSTASRQVLVGSGHSVTPEWRVNSDNASDLRHAGLSGTLGGYSLLG